MKTRKSFLIIYTLLAMVYMLFFALPAFPDNKIEIMVTNSSVIVPADDSISNRLLFKFDLPSSLNDKRIDYAEIDFYTKVDSLSSQSVMLTAYPLTTDWNKSTASWSSPWGNSGGDFNDSLGEIGMVKSSGEEKVRLDITHMVERWQKQTLANYGLVVFPLETDRKIDSLEHHPGLASNVYAKVVIYFSYTHP